MFRKTLPLMKATLRTSSSTNEYFRVLFSEGSVETNQEKSKKSLEKSRHRLESARVNLEKATREHESAKKIATLFTAHHHETTQLMNTANKFKEHFLQGVLNAVTENKTHFKFEFYGKDCSTLFSQLQPFLQQCGFTVHGNAYINEKHETINRYHAVLMSTNDFAKQTTSKSDEITEPTPQFLKNFMLEINNRLEEAKRTKQNPNSISLSRSFTGC